MTIALYFSQIRQLFTNKALVLERLLILWQAKTNKSSERTTGDQEKQIVSQTRSVSVVFSLPLSLSLSHTHMQMYAPINSNLVQTRRCCLRRTMTLFHNFFLIVSVWKKMIFFLQFRLQELCFSFQTMYMDENRLNYTQ